MNITLEEIISELKANYGLLQYASCLDVFTFKPKTSFKFEEYVTGPFQLMELLESNFHISDIPHGLIREEVLREICECLSKRTS